MENRIVGSEIRGEISSANANGVWGMIAIIAALAAVVFILLPLAFSAYDQQECGRVIAQSKQNLPGFFVSDFEAAACARAHMSI